MSDEEHSEAARVHQAWVAKLDALEAGDFSDWHTDTAQILVGLDRERTICRTKIPPTATAVFKHNGECWVLDSMTTHVTMPTRRPNSLQAFSHGFDPTPVTVFERTPEDVAALTREATPKEGELISLWDTRGWIPPARSINKPKGD